MKKQTIKKEITINATGEKVWNVLVDDQLTRAWYSEFSQGTHAQTDWKEGSKAVFADGTQSGLIATVVENKPAEILSMEFEGILNEGREEYDSELAKAVKGGRETYKLVQQDGQTKLYVECDTSEEMYPSMSGLWDKAVVKIKDLAERL